MKNLLLILFALLTTQLFSQAIFDEDFETIAVGTDLTSQGYVLANDAAYTGTVTASVAESNGNKFARMVADVNAGAKMQISKIINVVPGKTYKYSVDSYGPFKRQLRITSLADVIIASSADYKPATTAEETTWKSMDVSFITDAGVNQVKVVFYHYWSGTVDIDNFLVEESIKQTAYYVSSSTGDDNNPGTQALPWKSIEKANSFMLAPGDSILFKRGDTFNGRFIVNGSGTTEDPIFISAYGEGEKPIISGQVGAANGGDYAEAIRIENCDNLILDGIEVQNERLVTRSGVNDTDAFGISINNSSDKVMENLVFRNLKVNNVYAVQPMLNPSDFDAIQVSGIRFTCNKNTVAGKEKNINGVLIENCYFTDLQRLGIQFKHSGGADGIGNDSINRNMNIVIRNNEFYYNGGSAVLPNATYNCLIENNIFDHPGASTDPRMPGRGSSVWNYNAFNTVVQYNMCLSTRGYLDSYGLHIDKHNTNTFYQYNYMDDCIGGFVEILADNKNAVYRFNVSKDSGFRYTEGVSTWKAGSSTIFIYSDRWTEPDQSGLMLCDSVFIYNNTVVIEKPFTTTFSVDGKNINIYNNIFSSTNGATMGHLQFTYNTNGTPLVLKNNLYNGNVNPEWVSLDAAPVSGNPGFTGTGENKSAYELTYGSPAINAGANIKGPIVKNAGSGIFKDITPYPTVDFYGNPVDMESGQVNIGAYNGKPSDVSVVNLNQEEKEWLVYPNADKTKLFVINKGDYSGELKFELYNLKGQLITSEQKQIDPSNNQCEMALNPNISNGIYILNLKGDKLSHSRRIVLCK